MTQSETESRFSRVAKKTLHHVTVRVTEGFFCSVLPSGTNTNAPTQTLHASRVNADRPLDFSHYLAKIDRVRTERTLAVGSLDAYST